MSFIFVVNNDKPKHNMMTVVVLEERKKINFIFILEKNK
jgi:hypothetical protein